MVLGDHDVDIVRIHLHADIVSHLRGVYGLNDHLALPGLHGDLIVHTLEDHGGDRAADGSVRRCRDDDILRADHCRDVGALGDVVHALELAAAETGLQLSGHDAVEDVALADEVRHEGILRLVVDHLRRADLLDPAFRHDHDGVGHGQRFFLVMGDVDESDAETVVHLLQLQLHLLPHLQIQGAQRLVQKQDLRLVDQSAGNGDTLLLSAGQSADGTALKALQVHQLQDPLHLLLDHILRHLLLAETEGDVFIDVHVGEQGVALEDRVDGTLVRRQRGNVLPVQKDLPGGRQFKAGDHPECRGLSAAGRPQERDKFSFVHVKVEIRDCRKAVVIGLRDVLQFNDLFFSSHCCSPPV